MRRPRPDVPSPDALVQRGGKRRGTASCRKFPLWPIAPALLLLLVVPLVALRHRLRTNGGRLDTAYLRDAFALPSRSSLDATSLRAAIASYSLRHALAAGLLADLRLHCAYEGALGMWNALPHIEKLLVQAGYAGRARSWAGAATLVVPNYWRPGAADWRTWRLAPYQRINRLWGMYRLSRKETLVRTLDAQYGRGRCPFTPRTYVYSEMITSSTWKALVASQPTWLLKTSAHKGQGLRLVDADDLLTASAPSVGGSDSGEVASLRSWLRQHAQLALLQQPVDDPMLIGARKFSVRLYALCTSGEPLRVYVHTDGFALFASHEYNTSTASSDRLAFLTNAHVNAHASRSDSSSSPHAEGGGEGGERLAAASSVGVDRAVARSLGLSLPPHTQRWTLTELVSFVEARQRLVAKGRSRSGRSGASSDGSLLRALHRLVLLTFVAARPQLRRAAAESLEALGLSGPHEYAATFELAAFDVMLDAEAKPWLLEVNTSPSLKVEEEARGGARFGYLRREVAAALGVGDSHWANGPSGGGGGDLAIKMRVVGDMLRLVDAIPDDATAESVTAKPAEEEAQVEGGEEPPEAVMAHLLVANARRRPSGDTCARHWRLGGCRHCPNWAQVAQLWRAAAELRRAGGFIPLAPSTDAEWASLARQPRRAGTSTPAPAHEAAIGGAAADSASDDSQPPTAHELLEAWTGTEGGDCSGRRATQCVRRRWDAMLCP